MTRASLVAQLIKKPPAKNPGRPGFGPWVRKIPWRRERLPTPVFWPGKFHGLHCPWGRKESDTTERLHSLTHTVKDFNIVVETEIGVFLEFSCFPYVPGNVGNNLISASSSFSKPSLDIWKFLVHIMLKPSMQDFEYDFTSMGDECNCLMVSAFFGTNLLGKWDED